MTSPGNARPLVVVRGAGDIATGTGRRLFLAGFGVVMTEIAEPLCVRRTVSFAEAIREGECRVEGVTARRASLGDLAAWPFDESVAVVADPDATCIDRLAPDVVVDARLLKRATDTTLDHAPVVGGLGPGFTAGVDCHFVVETLRGHDLGRVILEGAAAPNTGVPGTRGGHSRDRVIYTEASGIVEPIVAIGDRVEAGDALFAIGGTTHRSTIDGLVRGMLRAGLAVGAGVKAADVDPVATRTDCETVSDRSNAIAGGVLEGIFRCSGSRFAIATDSGRNRT